MNWKKFILLLSCVVPCVFAVSTATAQMMGHRASTARMPMHPAPMLGSTGRMPTHRAPMLGSTARMPMHRAPMLGSTGRMPTHRAPMLGSTARMPVHRAPMLNSASGFQRSRGGGFGRDDRFRSFNRFNDGDFDRDDDRFNEIIVFDNFGFPFSPFFGSAFFPFYYPQYGYGGYGYQGGYDQYGYGGYGYQGGYGNGSSSVVQLQRRLARAGYYHGAIDGIMGPATRRAIRVYERTHNQRAYGMTDRY